MALPFLKAESEESATQAIAFIGVIAVTAGLCFMNVAGALAGSQGMSVLQVVIRGALAIILAGAEILAAVALVRVMLAPNLFRKVVGTLIFIGLAWACIQNGKRAAHIIFPEFQYSASLLDEKARIAGEQASERQGARSAARDALPAILAGVQGDIAKLEEEQQLMRSTSEVKVKEAQQLLITYGYYNYGVDGKVGPETERAMRARGEDISKELSRLKLQEQNLLSGMISPDSGNTGATDIAETAATSAAVLKDKAERAREAAIWIEVMLWVLEGARSFGLWALVTTVTSRKRMLTDDEWDLWEKYKKRRDAQLKEEEPSEEEPDQILLGGELYWTTRIEKALKTRMSKPTAEGMANTYFGGLEIPILEGHLNLRVKAGKLTPEDRDFILRQGEYAPEQLSNGTDLTPIGQDDVDDSTPDRTPSS